MSGEQYATEVTDILYALRAHAAAAATTLRAEVEKAQALLATLDRIADQADVAAALVDASALGDREFGQAFVPPESAMVRPDRPNGGLNPTTPTREDTDHG